MNLIFKKYDESDVDAWDHFVYNESLNGTIYHTRNFLNYHKNRFC